MREGGRDPQTGRNAPRRWATVSPELGLGLRRSDAFDALNDELERLRPWQDQALVRSGLTDWIRAYRPMWIGRFFIDGVAEHLASIGQWPQPPDRDSMTGITWFMLVEVSQGREPNDTSLGYEVLQGIPDRTQRADRKQCRETAAQHRIKRIQQDLDIAELVRGHRRPQAARAWLRRHPGLHAKDAADGVRIMSVDRMVIDGTVVEPREGRLVVRTSPGGRYQWHAVGQLPGVDRTLNRLLMGGNVRVEFDTRRNGTIAGQAFVEANVSTCPGPTQTWFRLRGTGDLKGVAVEELDDKAAVEVTSTCSTTSPWADPLGGKTG